MVALTGARKTEKRVRPGDSYWDYQRGATATVFHGSLVGLLAGRVVPASADPNIRVVGRATVRDAISETAATDNVRVDEGTSQWANGDAIAVADIGLPAFAQDDQTVHLSSNGGLRPFAGIIMDVDTLGVWVFSSVDMAGRGGGGSSGPAGALRARYVMTTNVADLAAFTVLQDGVTGVEDNLVLLAGQTSKEENGLHALGVVAAGVGPLSRPSNFASGTSFQDGTECTVAEGTLNADSKWFIPTDAGVVQVDTTVHDWYPERITQTVAFPVDTGLITIANVPILSATKTYINAVNVSEVTADVTVRYALDGAATAGVVGTATVDIIAELAAGTVNVDDDSTMLITVANR